MDTKAKIVLTKNQKLGKQIKRLRKQRGLTQEELAEKAGKSVTWIAYIENGYKKPNLALLYKIARILGAKTKDLFTF